MIDKIDLKILQELMGKNEEMSIYELTKRILELRRNSSASKKMSLIKYRLMRLYKLGLLNIETDNEKVKFFVNPERCRFLDEFELKSDGLTIDSANNGGYMLILLNEQLILAPLIHGKIDLNEEKIC